MWAAETALREFALDRSNLAGAQLFMFGSVDAVLKADDRLFESLERLPYFTYINVGLESADPVTLETLQKPLDPDRVGEAFARMVEINRSYSRIEMTSNFVFGEDLPRTHTESILELTRNRFPRPYSKGTVYLSPIVDDRPLGKDRQRRLLRRINAVQTKSRLPTYLYLIQRI